MRRDSLLHINGRLQMHASESWHPPLSFDHASITKFNAEQTAEGWTIHGQTLHIVIGTVVGASLQIRCSSIASRKPT